MILTVHLLTGAALVSKIQSIPLALFLAFLSHYFLDFLPHPDEYSIRNIKEKRWRKSFFDFLKIGIDIFIGLLIIFILAGKQPIIYAGAFLAILPDFFTFLGIIFSNKLWWHNDEFHEKIHFTKYQKISFFWRFFIQLIVSIIALLSLVF